MQLLHNSGYNKVFRAEILKSEIHGYIKILAAEKEGLRPMHRPKNWGVSSLRMDKQKKKKNWLGRSVLEVMYFLFRQRKALSLRRGCRRGKKSYY